MGTRASQQLQGRCASHRLVERLRGTRGLRPPWDRHLAGGLRAWLEDGIYELLGPDAPALRVGVNDVAPGEGHPSPLGVLRGALCGRLVALHATSSRTAAPFDAAVLALRATEPHDPVLATLATLDADELARLRSEVDAHGAILAATLDGLPTRWAPRCGVRMSVPLAGGRVLCSGRIDLALGVRGGSHAGVCLVDVTTSPLDPRHEVSSGYLALLETLRTGEPPLRVAVCSTAQGAALVRDVDAELLGDAVVDLLDALATAAAA